MNNQLTSNAEALKLFFTEDVYLVENNIQEANVELIVEKAAKVKIKDVVLPKTESLVYEDNVGSLPIVQEATEVLKTKLDFKFLGKNKKNILILVNDSAHEVSTEQGRELLRNLVNAISLTANDFALVNYATYSKSTFADLNDFFDCKTVLAFGVNPSQLALDDFSLHELVKIDETKLIFTTNLNDLSTDNASKTKLWASLQKLK